MLRCRNMKELIYVIKGVSQSAYVGRHIINCKNSHDMNKNLNFNLHNKLRSRCMHFLWEVYRYSADRKSLLYFGIFTKMWHLDLFWATSKHSLKSTLSKMQLKYYLPIYNKIFCETCFLQCFQPIMCSYFSFSCTAGLMHLDSVTPAIIGYLQGSTHLFQGSNLPLQYFDSAPI
jgi:hypothetical protein